MPADSSLAAGGRVIGLGECAIYAIEAFRADPMKYDLVITHMTMPRLTGDETARKIKTLWRGKQSGLDTRSILA